MTVMVDDYLPLTKQEDGSYKTVYAHISSDGSLWGPILEKVFAKRYGNYQHIISGYSSEAVRSLTGSPYQYFTHKETDLETLWKILSTHDKKNDFITASTEGTDDSTTNSVGLV